MLYVVRINNTIIFRTRQNAEARRVANRVYESIAEFILTGNLEDEEIVRILKKNDAQDDITITINFHDWEDFIPECEWIKNRKVC